MTLHDSTTDTVIIPHPSAPVQPTPANSSYEGHNGRPGPGLIVVGLGWLGLGALLLAIGGPVFAGILQAVS